MKKNIYLIFFTIIIFLTPIASGGIINLENDSISSQDYTDKTLLIGTIYNPIESGLNITAYAISLVYYNHNLTYETIGLVQGLNKISFERMPFLYLYRPGPLGLIAYVFGFCTNFKIQ